MQAQGLTASLLPAAPAARQARSRRRVAVISLARSGATQATAKLLSFGGGYGSPRERFHASLRALRPVASGHFRDLTRPRRAAVVTNAAAADASDAGQASARQQHRGRTHSLGATPGCGNAFSTEPVSRDLGPASAGSIRLAGVNRGTDSSSNHPLAGRAVLKADDARNGCSLRCPGVGSRSPDQPAVGRA